MTDILHTILDTASLIRQTDDRISERFAALGFSPNGPEEETATLNALTKTTGPTQDITTLYQLMLTREMLRRAAGAAEQCKILHDLNQDLRGLASMQLALIGAGAA